jgi:hypothetical protein
MRIFAEAKDVFSLMWFSLSWIDLYCYCLFCLGGIAAIVSFAKSQDSTLALFSVSSYSYAHAYRVAYNLYNTCHYHLRYCSAFFQTKGYQSLNLPKLPMEQPAYFGFMSCFFRDILP